TQWPRSSPHVPSVFNSTPFAQLASHAGPPAFTSIESKDIWPGSRGPEVTGPGKSWALATSVVRAASSSDTRSPYRASPRAASTASARDRSDGRITLARRMASIPSPCSASSVSVTETGKTGRPERSRLSRAFVRGLHVGVQAFLFGLVVPDLRAQLV